VLEHRRERRHEEEVRPSRPWSSGGPSAADGEVEEAALTVPASTTLG
jgi:hypothetical protein